MSTIKKTGQSASDLKLVKYTNPAMAKTRKERLKCFLENRTPQKQQKNIL